MRRDDGSDIDIAFHEAHLTLRDGTPLLIRRLVAEDAALYPDFLSDVTGEDLRLRFFGPMREVSHELLDKLIHYDPACAMAFIAVDEQSQKMLGVVRLHDDTSGETAEFANREIDGYRSHTKMPTAAARRRISRATARGKLSTNSLIAAKTKAPTTMIRAPIKTSIVPPT